MAGGNGRRVGDRSLGWSALETRTGQFDVHRRHVGNAPVEFGNPPVIRGTRFDAGKNPGGIEILSRKEHRAEGVAAFERGGLSEGIGDGHRATALRHRVLQTFRQGAGSVASEVSFGR